MLRGFATTSIPLYFFINSRKIFVVFVRFVIIKRKKKGVEKLQQSELHAPKQYNIVMEIEKHAAKKDKVALLYLDETGNRQTITYEQLVKNVNRIGNVLLEAGLQKGNKLLVMVSRTIEAYEVYLACLKIGVIIVPSSEMLTTSDLQYRVTHGSIDGVISEARFAPAYEGLKEYEAMYKFSLGHVSTEWMHLDEAKKHASEELEIAVLDKDVTAFLPYTSGTTGYPKAVVHTHSWGYTHLRTVAENWLDIKETDTVWATAAPGWQKWIWSPFLATLGSGATAIVYNGRFSAEKYLTILQNEKVDVLCCTPTEYRMIAATENLASYNLSTLRSAVSAGEPLNRKVIELFKQTFDLTVRDGYGQTENTLLLGIMKDMEVKPGSMGKPTPGNHVEVIDDEGNPVEAGIVGDIALALDSPALFKEYYRDEEKTHRSKRGNFYVTGDRAYKDEDGYFWFEGRDDDIIVSSGYTIGPFEVEDAIVKHVKVKECAVVASPDEIRGAIVKAYIVLKDATDACDALVKDIQTHVKTETAPYKYPREIEFVTDLPKTSSGKIRRVELRAQEFANKNN